LSLGRKGEGLLTSELEKSYFQRWVALFVPPKSSFSLLDPKRGVERATHGVYLREEKSRRKRRRKAEFAQLS